MHTITLTKSISLLPALQELMAYNIIIHYKLIAEKNTKNSKYYKLACTRSINGIVFNFKSDDYL